MQVLNILLWFDFEKNQHFTAFFVFTVFLVCVFISALFIATYTSINLSFYYICLCPQRTMSDDTVSLLSLFWTPHFVLSYLMCLWHCVFRVVLMKQWIILFKLEKHSQRTNLIQMKVTQHFRPFCKNVWNGVHCLYVFMWCCNVERNLMLENVCSEIYHNEFRLASHPIVSRTLQQIIDLAPHHILGIHVHR